MKSSSYTIPAENIGSAFSWHMLPAFDAFPGGSQWVKNLNLRLRILGASRSHVLIQGEAGTWKDLAARLIHYYGDPASPVLFLDCASPPLVIANSERGIRNVLPLENAQETALFGTISDCPGTEPLVRRGALELAAGGDLFLRNIDSLTSAMQEKLCQFLETGQFGRLMDSEWRGGVRIIASKETLRAFNETGRFRRSGESEWREAMITGIETKGESLARLAECGRFNKALFKKLSAETIDMMPLNERKKDIPVMTSCLLKSLNAQHHKCIQRLSQKAHNLLIDHDWPLNCSELYQVLSRAVILCNDEEVGAEHIVPQKSPFPDGRFNLLTLALAEKFTHRPDFPRVLRKISVPFFLLLTVYALLGPQYGNAANLAVWTLWWPSLLLTTLFFARGWCSWCPLEAISEFIGAKTGVVRNPDTWLRLWGPTLSLSGIVLILLVEQASGMFSRSFATGLLLSGLFVATATSDLILGRRGWCKYLCPLGRIVGLMSRMSFLEMHSNRTVCAVRCRIDECVKEKECPMGLHPSGIDNSDHCILCLDCVRNCTHHAMQLDIRNPVQGLLNNDRRGFNEAFFSVTLVGVIIAAKATPLVAGRRLEVFSHTLWSLPEFILALFISAVFTGTAMLVSAGVRGHGWKPVFAACGIAYLPMAFTGLFVLYYRALVEGGAQLVPLLLTATGFGQWLDIERLTPEFGTLRLLIYPIILAGALSSWLVLGRLHEKQSRNDAGFIGHRLLV
ncbi:MAG: sigma 54-interacting transcriptional regulator, partial [Desulfuromonadaceae bacterium]|nr:sigma 54-interacting transcriptional regulator [Desulfuromonadaceae bacterium]